MTQLATIQTKPVGYTSLFERFQSFEEACNLANMMAQSCFVPSSFRRDGPQVAQANCLIAIDLANTLGIKPTSIFPHLYVIDGRPSLSAQFIIALVNRTGRFSIIEWEEGEEGVVTYEGYGGAKKSIPNYYAVAKFTELSTGKEFRSTRVDVELARRSGWLTKNGSKWQTNPREMARWRSASWLVKNYCPETILGFDATEDVKDYQAEELRSDARAARESSTISNIINVSSVPKIADETNEDDKEEESDERDVERELVDAINAAQTTDELQSVASQIARQPLDAYQRDRIRTAYKARQGAIRAQVDKVVDTTPETSVEPARTQPAKEEKKTAVKKSTKRATKESAGLKTTFEFVDDCLKQFCDGLKKCSSEGAVDCLETVVKKAQTPVELEDYSEIATALKKNGDFTNEQVQTVAGFISARFEEITPTQKERFEYIKTRLEYYASQGNLETAMKRVNCFGFCLDEESKEKLSFLTRDLAKQESERDASAQVDPILQAIKGAQTTDDLNEIQTALQAQFDAGEIQEGTFGRYLEIIEAKALNLEELAPEPEHVGARQKRNEEEIRKNLDAAKTRKDVENVERVVEKFGSDGSITRGQAAQIKKDATRRKSELLV